MQDQTTLRLIGGTCLAVVLGVSAAFANGITAADVLNKMSKDEQFGYISGIVDSYLYMEQPQFGGTKERSACILEWFYRRKPAEPAQGPKDVVAFFEQNLDKPAVGLVKILIDRKCGKRQ